MNTETLIARKLLQINAIKLNPQNPFTWTSGMRSPIYCDNRVTLSHPEVRTAIKEAFAKQSVVFGEIDMIAGVATAGIPHGALLADKLGLPFCYVRSSPKEHGRQNQIEGELRPGSRVLVIEDLISTGGSSVEVVGVLRREGHIVDGVMAIFDYGFAKAAENFMNIDCKVISLSNYKTLIREAGVISYITEEEQKVLESWNSDPQNWYSKHFGN